MAVKAYETGGRGQPTDKEVNLYNMEMVRQFFGGINAEKLTPKTFFAFDAEKMNARLITGSSAPVIPDEDVSLAGDDQTVALLLKYSKGRERCPKEQAFLDAERYSQWYANRLRLRNISDKLYERVDYRADYYVGALEAIRNGIVDPAKIISAGMRSMFCRRRSKNDQRRNKAEKNNPVIVYSLDGDLTLDVSGKSGTFAEILAEDPDCEIRACLSSGVG